MQRTLTIALSVSSLVCGPAVGRQMHATNGTVAIGALLSTYTAAVSRKGQAFPRRCCSSSSTRSLTRLRTLP